jgi:alpha-galactosidase
MPATPRRAERHEPAVSSLPARQRYPLPGKQTAPGASQYLGRIYFNHDPDYIMRMADEAAALGVERFIIDDGWFKGRNDDHAALGDWYLDEKKYPNGLTPVIDHVKRSAWSLASGLSRR